MSKKQKLEFEFRTDTLLPPHDLPCLRCGKFVTVHGMVDGVTCKECVESEKEQSKGESMKNLPKKIYLQFGCSDEEKREADFKEIQREVSWCAEQIDDNDECYVLESEIKRLTDENERLKGLPREILKELKLANLGGLVDIRNWECLEHLFAKYIKD